nr:hypothetical protein CFP56_11199 [Quercus suber]
MGWAHAAGGLEGNIVPECCEVLQPVLYCGTGGCGEGTIMMGAGGVGGLMGGDPFPGVESDRPVVVGWSAAESKRWLRRGLRLAREGASSDEHQSQAAMLLLSLS